MTAQLTGFRADTNEIILRMDAMQPRMTIGDIWLVQSEKDRCVWQQNFDGYYETACEQAYDMEGHTPQEHGFNFCPFCGLLITSEAYHATTDDE